MIEQLVCFFFENMKRRNSVRVATVFWNHMRRLSDLDEEELGVFSREQLQKVFRRDIVLCHVLVLGLRRSCDLFECLEAEWDRNSEELRVLVLELFDGNEACLDEDFDVFGGDFLLLGKGIEGHLLGLRSRPERLREAEILGAV